jgi:hypothetical protein
MKYVKLLLWSALLMVISTESMAQVFLVRGKQWVPPIYQAADVQSILHDDAEGVITFYFKDGSKQSYPKAETDSIVWYDPTNSILSKLSEKGNFNYFIRLVKFDSPWDNYWIDGLDGATEATVFAANDDNWERFFAENAKLPTSNPWHTATSYDELTKEQKRALLYSAIARDNTNRQEIIRSKTSTTGIESLQHLSASEVPVTYSPVDRWYWERFHEANGGNGVYIVADSTYHYTSFFTPEKLKFYGLTDLDYAILFPQSAKSIANGVDVQQEISVSNGYLYETAAPLIPLQSMAEVIRTNGRTNIFSHMLDRYSAPFYNHDITMGYRGVNPLFTDSIFTKRYFSDMSASGRRLNSEPGEIGGTYRPYYPYKYTSEQMPNELKVYAGYGEPYLKFDPAWNEYYEDPSHPENCEKDMAAMFVPSDEALWRFFTNGAGLQLIKTYYQREGTEYEIPYTVPAPGDYEALYRQIDCIPLTTLQILINTTMIRSFLASIPSKMTKCKDNAMEQLFYPEDIEKIDTCLLASNGAVYIMDKVYGPADFTSVTAPAYMSTTNRIINWAIYDQNSIRLNYYAYLKAPQQDITFFLPSDAALAYYYDPISMKSRSPRVITMSYKNVATGRVAVTAKCWKYIDPYGIFPASAEQPKGSIGGQLMGSAGQIDETDITNRLRDILLNHTILNDGTQNINSRNEYYRTLSGDVVKVIRDASGKIVGAKGTFQLENERQGITGNETSMGVTGCNVTASFESLSNGQTFTLDAPLIPTYRSLWSILTDDMKETDSRYNPKGYTDEAWEANPYSAFYDLCAADRYQDAIMGCGLVDGSQGPAARNAAMQKYLIFTNGYGLDYNFAPLIGNTPYTAYIPTNEAVRRAIAQGLPTWEDIYEDYQSHRMPDLDPDTGKPYTNDEGEIEYTNMLQSAEDSIRIANKILTLTNFIKAHFHFGMAIADQEPFQGEYKSLAMDENLVSRKLTVNSTGNGNMTVTDWNGRTFNVLDNKNVFAHDYTCNKSPRGVAMYNITFNGKRPCVIHQIDGVIGFK